MGKCYKSYRSTPDATLGSFTQKLNHISCRKKTALQNFLSLNQPSRLNCCNPHLSFLFLTVIYYLRLPTLKLCSRRVLWAHHPPIMQSLTLQRPPPSMSLNFYFVDLFYSFAFKQKLGNKQCSNKPSRFKTPVTPHSVSSSSSPSSSSDTEELPLETSAALLPSASSFTNPVEFNCKSSSQVL